MGSRQFGPLARPRGLVTWSKVPHSHKGRSDPGSGSARLRKGLKKIPNNDKPSNEMCCFIDTQEQSTRMTAWSTFTKVLSVQHLPTVFLAKTAMDLPILVCRNARAFPEPQSADPTIPITSQSLLHQRTDISHRDVLQFLSTYR